MTLGPYPIAGIALLAWPLITLLIFSILPPRRAVLASVIGGTLFLPHYGVELPGPNLTKAGSTAISALFAAMAVDWGRFGALRFNWVDVAMVTVLGGSVLTSIFNGLGAYDGMTFAVDAFSMWGAAYLLGRAYFGDREGLRELAVGLFIGGLIYIPLCLWEIRMSPQLNNTIYGYHTNKFHMTNRFGGYRPTVFMQHGIMVGAWMACASLLGLWLWRAKLLRPLWGAPAGLLVAAQWLVTVFVKSGNAYFMLAFGLAAMIWTRGLWSRMALFAAIVAAPTYMLARGTAAWDAAILPDLARSVLNEDRAKSLEGRLFHETQLAAKAREQPLLGWGAWSRNRITDDYGEDTSVTDGLWIIVFGQRGLVGIGGLTVAMLGGAAVVAWRLRGRKLVEASWAPAAALVVIVGLVMIDNLFNAMLNPVYTLAAGGLASLAFNRSEWRGGPPRRRSEPDGLQPVADEVIG